MSETVAMDTDEAAAPAAVPAQAPEAEALAESPVHPPLLRLRGEELQQACDNCSRELCAAEDDFDARFLVFDYWLRIFDGEPLPRNMLSPVASANAADVAVEVATEKSSADTDAVVKDDASSATADAAPVPEPGAKAPDASTSAGPETAANADGSPAPVNGAQSGSTHGRETKGNIEIKPVKRFAKYKRLKEAFQLYRERFDEDVFQSLIPAILKVAAQATSGAIAEARCAPAPRLAPVRAPPLRAQKLTETAVEPDQVSGNEDARKAEEGPKVMRVSASEVLKLLANMMLLNVRGNSDLQKLYLSSAKAAPQKLLCLLLYFRSAVSVAAGGDDGERQLCFERCADAVKLPDAAPGADGGPTLEVATPFLPDFRSALGSSTSACLIMLSSADSFGKVADVKTPTEEVPIWEAPELLCVRPLLGTVPLAEGEVFLVSGIRHLSRCTTEGPLLTLAGEVQPPVLLDVAAVSLSRHLDDRRFAVKTLQQDGAKLLAALRRLGPRAVAVIHPPMLGVDRHLAFALHLLCASCARSTNCGAGEPTIKADGAGEPKIKADGDVVSSTAPAVAGECSEGAVTETSAATGNLSLRYGLCADYTTGAPSMDELSPPQVKEAKHFEALANRMRAAGWRAGELLGLLALYPFGRAKKEERFHAFWTRRLRDTAAPGGGRPTEDELISLASRQEELEPPPPVVTEPAPAPQPQPVQQTSPRDRSRDYDRARDKEYDRGRNGDYTSRSSRSGRQSYGHNRSRSPRDRAVRSR